MDRLSKQIGKERAKTMKKRIDQLKASVNFAQYLLTGLGKPHLLEGNCIDYNKSDPLDPEKSDPPIE